MMERRIYSAVGVIVRALVFFMPCVVLAQEKSTTMTSIAAAKQEGKALTREALITSWMQREQAELDRDKAQGRYAHAAIVPVWPGVIGRSRGAHNCAVEYSFSYYANGIDASGKLVDSSVVRFLKQPTLADILVASSLSNLSNAQTGVGYEFLQDLSTVAIPFQSSVVTHECSLSYVLSLANNAFQFGVRVPFRQQFRSVKIVPILNSASQALLRETDPGRNAQFRDFYGSSVRAMIEDVIVRKNMMYSEHLSYSALGDMSFFTAINFSPWRLDRWSFSAELIVPGEKTIETQHFYPIIPESQGCLSGRLSTGFVGNKTLIGAPHLMVSGQVYFPAEVSRRVPRMITANASTSLPDTEVFGLEISFDPPAYIFAPETSMPDFASQVTTVSLCPGFAIDLRAGSVITPFTSPLMQLDLYYHFRMRGSDALQSGLSPSTWNTSTLLAEPYRAQHNVGFSYVYQPTSQLQIRTGFEGVVWARSMPIEIIASISISGSF